MLGQLPASDFAPHLFDEGQQLPFSLPPDRPEEGIPKDNRLKQSHKPVSVESKEFTPAPTKPEPAPVISTPKPPAVQPSVDLCPPQDLTVPTEPVAEPPLPKRRGRPPGSKNKPRVCPNCTATCKCVAHCEFCKGGLACDSHNVQDRCAKCTKTRLCVAHR